MRAADRRRIFLRRVAAVGLAAGATLLIWTQLGLSGGGGGVNGGQDEAVSAPVKGLVAKLSPTQKVDGLFILGFSGTDASAPFLRQLRHIQLGGVFLGSQNWTDSTQGAALIAELKAAARRGGSVPPLIAVNQEGGTYRSLPGLPPGQGQFRIGSLDSPARAEAWARQTGNALRALGIDTNLDFPVADVAALASPISDRSFSDDPAIVADMTAAAVRGCAAGALVCAAGHFPGLGSASQDTDQGPATVSLDRSTLEQRDVTAFRAAIAEHVPALLLSHSFYAAYDAVVPASLSSALTTDLLRGQLHFHGVAITDDLEAGAIRAVHSIPDAAVAAVRAGADMVWISGTGQEGTRAREAVLRAVRDGTIPTDRLNQAIGRVLEMKREAGILK